MGHGAERKVVQLEWPVERGRNRGPARIYRCLQAYRRRDAGARRGQFAMGLARQLAGRAGAKMECLRKLLSGENYCDWVAFSAYGPTTPTTSDGTESFRFK